MSTDLAPTEQQLTPAKRTFEAIADDLSAYQESLELVEANIANSKDDEERDALIDDRVEIQAHIDRIGAELVTKTDSCAGVLRRLASEDDLIAEEIKRLQAKRKSTAKAREWLCDYVASVLRNNGWKWLKTPLNTISLQKNGGLQTLTIPDPRLVPDEYCDVMLRVPAAVLKGIRLCVANHYPHQGLQSVMHRLDGERVTNNEVIRAALAKPCVKCEGLGEVLPSGPSDAPVEQCPTCQGDGKARISGAKLEPRGFGIRVR